MMFRIYAIVLLLVQTQQSECLQLPLSCKQWSKIEYRQCCTCQSSLYIVCSRGCPLGYYKSGNFMIEDGHPSKCLKNFIRQSDKVQYTAELCSPCNAHCKNCNGPTDAHCEECTYGSYKDVGDQSQEFGRSEIIASSLLLPDGNLVVVPRPSVRRIRKKRVTKEDPLKESGIRIIGESVRWNSSDGMSGYLSWRNDNINTGDQATNKLKVNRRRRFAGRRRGGRVSGRVLSTTTNKPWRTTTEKVKVTDSADKTISSTKPMSTKPTTKTPTTTPSAMPMSTKQTTKTPLTTPEILLTRNKTEPTTKIHLTRVPSTSTTTTKVTTVKLATTTKAPPKTTIIVVPPSIKTTSRKPPTTEAPYLGSTFESFKEYPLVPTTWFQCVPACPRGKFIVRETRCIPCKNCPGNRECHVIDVHNVCVQTCQPGFVKHIGLMECLCPGPVINQTCTQPVHVAHPQRLDSHNDSLLTNLSIVLPIGVCFLALGVIALYIYWKRKSNTENADGVQQKPALSVAICSKWCCYDPDTQQQTSGEIKSSNGIYGKETTLQNMNYPADDRWKEDTLGRITWKFDDIPNKPNPAIITQPNDNYGQSNKRWRLPIRWQVSTPPSIPKKNTASRTFSRVQAFLSKYSADSDENKESSEIYKQPPPTPKEKVVRNPRSGPGISVISRPQVVPAEVIQSWLHSSFHIEKSASSKENFPRRQMPTASHEAKQKRRSLRPVSNCYESVEGSMDTEEAIYESLSEEDDDDYNSYASVNDEMFRRPVYANMTGPPLHDEP